MITFNSSSTLLLHSPNKHIHEEVFDHFLTFFLPLPPLFLLCNTFSSLISPFVWRPINFLKLNSDDNLYVFNLLCPSTSSLKKAKDLYALKRNQSIHQLLERDYV